MMRMYIWIRNNVLYIISNGESPKRMNANVKFYCICPVALFTGIINLCPYITSWVDVTGDKKGTERAYMAIEHKINLCTGTADLENAEIPMNISKGIFRKGLRLY
jgi:hypothetical protein